MCGCGEACETRSMSPYAPIDEGLRRWALKNNFDISTECKEGEVRMFHMATHTGTIQVWVEPKADARFEVVACNNRLGSAKRLDRVPVAGAEIGSALDDLIALVGRWKVW